MFEFAKSMVVNWVQETKACWGLDLRSKQIKIQHQNPASVEE
jgi:hypothetical protein